MNFEISGMTKLILQIGALLLIGFIASKYVKKIITRIFRLDRSEEEITSENEQVTITVLKHTTSLIQYVIWIIVLLSIGALLQMTAFVQLLATVGVIVGYVARDFINDVFMGIIVITEQQFRVGDTITISDKQGIVAEIGIRTTTIILNSGEKYIISNRLITAVTVHPIELPPVRKRKQQKGAEKPNAKK